MSSAGGQPGILRALSNRSKLFSSKNPDKQQLIYEMMAEAWGTGFIVIFGVGSVCSAVLTGDLMGLGQVALVWGFGVGLAIYCTASVSGAHLNPAVSLALAIFRKDDFPRWKLGFYVLAQMLGSILAGFINLCMFGAYFAKYDKAMGVERGDPGSVYSARAFGEYFPNPGPFADEWGDGTMDSGDMIETPGHAFLVEAWGTFVLMFVILCLTDGKQKALKQKEMAPFLIGFCVATLINVYAPLTQAGWNPARDFGPRIVAWMIGYGSVAIPGPRNGFWVYIVGPLVGAPLAVPVYDFTIAPGLPKPKEDAVGLPAYVECWQQGQLVRCERQSDGTYRTPSEEAPAALEAKEKDGGVPDNQAAQ